MSAAKQAAVSINERNFIHAALRTEGIRVDGRTALDSRGLQLQFGLEPGNAEVRLGTTRVAACVTAELIEPYPDRPTEGYLNFYVDFSPMASEYFEQRPDVESQDLARVIDRCVRDSRAIDTEALCVVTGRRVWAIRVDIRVLDHQGNLVDAVCLAAVAALQHFRLPQVTVVGDRVSVHPLEQHSQPLSLHHVPICVSFAFFNPHGDTEHGGGKGLPTGGSGGMRDDAQEDYAQDSDDAGAAEDDQDDVLLVLDPSLKEELIADGSLTLALNAFDEVCCIQKPGGLPISLRTLLRCSKIASARARRLNSILDEALKKDSAEARLRMLRGAIRRYENPIEALAPIMVDEDNLMAGAMAATAAVMELA